VSLDALAGEAADFYRPLAEERGITLALVCGGNAVVSGDRDLLFEALVNLLDNALKFTPAGGMVTIGTSQTPLGPVLSVRDNGPGIPPHERSRVLKRFHRADRSRNVPGSGLGLSLIAVIVRLHGFQLVLGDAHPGLSAELLCWAA
jgi:signal transduction histidine kinase